MLVELYGLPGAGKTTFAQKLRDRCDYEIIKIRDKRELVWYNLTFLFRHPIRTCILAFFIVRYAGDSIALHSKSMNLFLHYNAKYEKARRFDKAVIDQGHFQNIISLFEMRVSQETVRSYISYFNLPDHLVVFDLDIATLDTRTRRRGYYARENILQGRRESWIRVSRENHRTFVQSVHTIRTNVTLIKDESDLTALEKRLCKSDPKKILYFANVRMPTEKVHGFQVVKMCEAFASMGCNVVLLVPTRKNPIKEDVYNYYSVKQNFIIRSARIPDPLVFARLLGVFAYFLQATMYLVAVAFISLPKNAICYTRSASVAWLLQKRGANRIILELHSWPKRGKRIFTRLISAADLVVCNSNGTQTKCREAGILKTLVAPNGVDIEKFARVSRVEARKKFSLPREKKIVLYSGSFQEWKGVGTLIGAWQILQSCNHNADLVLLGGTIENLHTESLRKTARSLKNVTFLGRRKTSEIPMALAAADVLILPNLPGTKESVCFTSPVKMFEYMASGRPIVASSLPSIREILSETIALFFEAGNIEDLAQKITQLLEDHKLQQVLAKAAQDKVRSYSWKARAKNIIDHIL